MSRLTALNDNKGDRFKQTKRQFEEDNKQDANKQRDDFKTGREEPENRLKVTLQNFEEHDENQITFESMLK